MSDNTTPPNLTFDELADRWGVTPRTLRNYRNAGNPMPKPAGFLGAKPARYLLAEVQRFEHENGIDHGHATDAEK